MTPASGFITPASGFVVGLLCGVGSYGGVLLFKERLGIDDALDVSSVHGLTGVIGSLLIGVYATSDVNPDGPNGCSTTAASRSSGCRRSASSWPPAGRAPGRGS